VRKMSPAGFGVEGTPNADALLSSRGTRLALADAPSLSPDVLRHPPALAQGPARVAVGRAQAAAGAVVPAWVCGWVA
jgi:hypothetical protein